MVLIEDQASGTQLIQTLRNENPRGVPPPTARRPEADKKTRLAGVTPMIERGQLLLPREAPWLGEFQRELLGFPSIPEDDQVDALSQMLIWVDARRQDHEVCFGAPILFVNGQEWDGDTSGYSPDYDGSYESYGFY